MGTEAINIPSTLALKVCQTEELGQQPSPGKQRQIVPVEVDMPSNEPIGAIEGNIVIIAEKSEVILLVTENN
jgi:hypothetical protein